MIKPLEAVDLPKDKEIFIYIPEEKDLPASDKSEEYLGEGSMIREGLTKEEIFLAATFQAAIEDDPEEDAIWRKYIK